MHHNYSAPSTAWAPQREARAPQLEKKLPLTATREEPGSNEDVAQPKIQEKKINAGSQAVPSGGQEKAADVDPLGWPSPRSGAS